MYLSVLGSIMMHILKKGSTFLCLAAFMSLTATPFAAAQQEQSPELQETLRKTSKLPVADQQTGPKTEAELREQYEKSMTYMLRRAKLVRTLAAQHILYLGENADAPDLKMLEDATQVVAFDLVCSDDTFDPQVLDQLATESSYRIAAQAAKSPIAQMLGDIGRQQSIEERMNLLGDVSTTVFMFQVGRRRGLFDSLTTDFGKDKFCDGLRGNIRESYTALTSGSDK